MSLNSPAYKQRRYNYGQGLKENQSYLVNFLSKRNVKLERISVENVTEIIFAFESDSVHTPNIPVLFRRAHKDKTADNKIFKKYSRNSITITLKGGGS